MQIVKVFNHINKESVELQKQRNRQLKVIKQKMEKLEDRFIYDELDPDIYKKHKAKLEEEITQISLKCSNVNGELSNHLKYLENVAFASQNLSKRWSLGNYPVKDKIQRAVFPQGLVINPEKREYLTKDINKLFLLRPVKSRDLESMDINSVIL